ncbi:MAG: AAA domain-containing protein [Ilumatobacter sp.]|uniref:AAA domain-containing protein n=1 Tax=Ilumatobacter sp. TaxID=1967498 RepID=UPI003297BB26
MTFARLLSEAISAEGLPATGDVLSIGLPFLRQLDDLHRSGRVSRLSGLDGLTFDGEVLRLDLGHTREPATDEAAMRRVNPERTRSGVAVVRRLGIDHGTGAGPSVGSLDVHDGTGDLPDRPVFVTGYRAWEQLHGTHDVLTDIHLAGMLLVSYATGLDLDVEESVGELAMRSRHLGSLNPGLHPVVTAVLGDMISPDRHLRPGDLGHVIVRLEHHRDLPADLDLSDAYAAADGWQHGVLAALRERVFDVSRRNRALYFKPSASALSLTEASVPLLLDVERIEPSDLLTWTGDAADAFRSGRRIDLERWCRFEEAPHLAPGLDTLISSERRLRAEHGQGRLRLVIAFLRWVDPDSGEVVDSPLVTLPAELGRKKGVRDRYRVSVENHGEVNPVLRHVFRKRFGILLAETVGTDHASLVALVATLEAMVRSTDQSISIDLIDTPRVNIIRRRAQLRVDAYVRRCARAQASSGRWRRQEHSYDSDDWRPLGLALYRRFVQPADLPLRSLAGASPRPRRPDSLSAPAETTTTGERISSQYEVSTGDVNRHRWEVDLCAVTLASLGSRRSSLSRDYDTLLSEEHGAAKVVGTPFDSMFSPEPKAARRVDTDPISVDQILVLPADDAQARAVRRGLGGESLIIQGPPGTGKSQTIANLIAASVADGRRVLFVCEKRAALDVVAQRLRQGGLGQLVATIHDSQLDRKAFITDLGGVYSSWLDDGVPESNPASTPESSGQRDDALSAVNSILVPLERVFVELGDARGGRLSVAETVERLVMLRLRGVLPAAHVVAGGVTVASWLDARPRLGEVATELARTGRTGPLGEVDVLRVAPSFVSQGDPVVAVRTLGDRVVAATTGLADVLGSSLSPSEVAVSSITTLSFHMPLLTALATHGALGALDTASGTHLDARAAALELERLVSFADAQRPVLDRWRTAPNAGDTAAALEIARSKENSFFKFLDGKWRQVDSLVRSQYRHELHQIRPTASQVLDELNAYHSAQSAVEAHRRFVQGKYGVADLRSALAAAEQLADDRVMKAVVTDGSTVDLRALEQAVDADAFVDRQVVVDADATLLDLQRIGNSMQRASVADERALVAWGRLGDVDADVIAIALDERSSLDEIECHLLTASLAATGASVPPAALGGAQLDQTVELLLHRYRSLLAANARHVADRARRSFRENVEFSDASMAGRSDEDKERKRAYRAGRRVLEREFDKKMRYRSIRELAAGDSGVVVRDLKPIWLMSPLSVSDTLPLDGDLFDVVVFDEASQIPVEDAVPTLFRAGQTVVVGDRMQLPPTRFFSTGSDEDDDIVVDADGEGDDQRITITLDADSFLTQADLSLDSTMLTWHYRSRSESLIGYSNHAFYDARLATIPDRSFDAVEREPIVVAGPDEAAENLATSFERPISFHSIERGVYEDRRNVAEADYIAEMVRAMLVAATGHTIGIVAFSEAQQTAIESSLAELAVLDRRFADLLEAEQVRTDDDEFVGLFVKNLENVQGDERDVIIMSVCYARNADGRMRMNFGPINQAGGERRLNVIFSRAKQHMMIVSSIVGSDITNTHNDGAAHLARFLDYAAAESVGGAGGESVLRSLRSSTASDGSRPVDERSAVATELAERLRLRGHAVDSGVGRSAFTIDVAVRRNGEYALGIMVDPGRTGTSPTERMIAEAGVLDAMGWPMTRVFVTEWWNDPDRVLDRIEHVLASPVDPS